MAPLLADVFERLFLRECCADASAAYATRFRVAIRWFCAALGRDARTSDLSPAALDLVAATLANANYSRKRICALRKALGVLWRFADRLGLAPPYVASTIATQTPLILPGAQHGSPLRHWRPGQRLHLPPAAPGTLRHYFETVYQPQRLPRADHNTLAACRSLFIVFWHWLGRDATLDDCTNETAAAFIAWQLKRGRSPGTCNRYRSHWFAVWNHAHAAGLVAAKPTVAKLPVDRNDPDAWSLAELAQLVAACQTFRPDKLYRGVSLPLLMRALVVVGFHTAVRRRSLFSITRADVDLDAGVVTVRGANVKTHKGRKYQLPAYAIDAVREIWLPERVLLFPMGTRWAGRLFEALIAHAGLPPSKHELPLFHKLRRSAATAAAAALDMRAACELLDHSSKNLTERYVDPTKIPANVTSGRLPAIGGAAGELAEACDLLAAGKPHLAAMAARIVLERAIGVRCQRLRQTKPHGVAAAVKLLAARGVISFADCRLVCRAAKIANRAAHGHDVDAAAVRDMIHVVAHFAGDNPQGPLQERTVV